MIICIAPLLAAALPAIGSAAAGLFSAIGGIFQSHKNKQAVNNTNKANIELAKYNWQQQKQMWNENNDYNTPVNQMKRLEAAGLNPNLVYGHGTVANTSSGTPTPQTPTLQSYTGNEISGTFNSLGSILGEYLNFQQSQANIDKTKQETMNLAENNALLQKEALHKDIQIAISGLNFAKTKEEAKIWAEKLRADIDKVTSSTVLDNSNAIYTDQKRFYQETWAPKLAQSTINLQNSSIALNAQKMLTEGVQRELARARVQETFSRIAVNKETANKIMYEAKRIYQATKGDKISFMKQTVDYLKSRHEFRNGTWSNKEIKLFSDALGTLADKAFNMNWDYQDDLFDSVFDELFK